MTYQHKPTEASLLASSWGALVRWHVEYTHPLSHTWRRIHRRGTWIVPERCNGHLLPWGVSTWTLGPSGQWHWATPPCAVARTCTWQRCPVGVLFSKWRSQFRYKNDNCCKMQCQVQMPYLEIFNLSVFPIFTDSWGCTSCANCE